MDHSTNCITTEDGNAWRVGINDDVSEFLFYGYGQGSLKSLKYGRLSAPGIRLKVCRCAVSDWFFKTSKPDLAGPNQSNQEEHTCSRDAMYCFPTAGYGTSDYRRFGLARRHNVACGPCTYISLVTSLVTSTVARATGDAASLGEHLACTLILALFPAQAAGSKTSAVKASHTCMF